MTTVTLLDMACANVASAPGTGTITLGTTLAGGFLSWADAGATNGGTFGYYIQDGNNREQGFGVYSSTGPTLTRNVTSASVNGVAQMTPISVSANAVVASSISAADILALQTLSSSTATSLTALTTVVDGLHSYISSVVYTSTQTITIPGTQCRVRLVGGGGGAAGTAGHTAGAGAGAYLEKFLSGLTVSHTLALTIGAAGTSAPTSGGDSTLASGTQTITTLTAHGGSSANASAGPTSGAGGTATNGDLNITGGAGIPFEFDITNPCAGPTIIAFAIGGSNPLGPASMGAGNNYGSGAAAATGTSAAGAQGVCIIDWYV